MLDYYNKIKLKILDYYLDIGIKLKLLKKKLL